MKGENQNHLPGEQILRAVIDEGDLAEDEQLHLRQCPGCQKKVGQLRNELHVFGERAKHAVPPFPGRLKLPEANPERVHPHFNWLPFFGAAAMGAFVLFYYFIGMHTNVSTRMVTQQSQETLMEDETLMREISEMVEYPLPDDLYEISGDYENSFDDDFLEFAVPDIQEDFQS